MNTSSYRIYESKVKAVWEDFSMGRRTDLSILNDTIRESWLRSKQYGVRHNQDIKHKVLDIKKLKDNMLYKIIMDNYDMLESFVKIMVIHNSQINIYDSVNKTLFNVLGDSYLEMDLDESTIGTNAASLAEITGSPITLRKYEHYHEILNNSHCVAAPFLDYKGKTVGSIFVHIYEDDLLDLFESVVLGFAEIINNALEYKEKAHVYEERYFSLSKRLYTDNIRQKNFSYTFDNIIGCNERLRKLKALAKQVAPSNVPVLINGETGTGKEVLAQAIHNESTRSKGPFVAINCGAIPDSLVESELFGYVAGAFTGALKDGKTGLLEEASSGTVFLDEIESMPMHIQVKLLRTLSSNMIHKIGATKGVYVDLRVIAATKKNLLKESDKGNFREDLFYRISTAKLNIPPLRDRTDDIPLLVDYIIKMRLGKDDYENKEIDLLFLEALKYYYWRGNIRELENVIDWSLLMASYDNKLRIDHLPDKIIKAYSYKKSKEIIHKSKQDLIEDIGILKIMEEIMIEEVLKDTGNNMNKAAKILGVSRKTLYNKLNNVRI